MSVDAATIRAESHAEIGFLIARDVDVLIERWTHWAVEEQPAAKRFHHAALVDHLRDFLKALGRSLAESDELAASEHCLPATIHGETRWESGWSLPEVVRDYQILRLVILDYLEQTLGRAPSSRAVMAIGLALDEAISASVTMYVNSRDEHQRRLEEERAERDKEIHEQLRQRAEMLKEVDRRKNEFMTVLGHEMRNPLAPLWHASSLLDGALPGDAHLREIRDIVKRQVQQLTRLADDLLDISRIAQNKIELRKEAVNLADTVTQAVEASTPYMRARLHHMEVTFTPEPLWVDADGSRLIQILGNLLNNAAKYTEPGGRISLVVERNGQDAVIRIRDTGIGIPPTLLPHIFELFTQGEWSADRSQGGMGIGLALVRRLVELHGGTIEASSDGIGQGSEFTIRLPLITAEIAGLGKNQHRDNLPSRAFAGAAPRRILVVDDNVDATTTLRMLLAVEHHEVRVAHDGLTALQVAQEFQPDVVLLDIELPMMDGYEVAQRLRQSPSPKKAVIVALTGYGQDEDRRRSAEAGFDFHLVKPVSLETLRSALATTSTG
jgi:signal transduction histidine kinase/ActR/RegA family two-component response regulator